MITVILLEKSLLIFRMGIWGFSLVNSKMNVTPRIIDNDPFWMNRSIAVEISWKDSISKRMVIFVYKIIFDTKSDKYLHIFTDGSKREEVVGCSMYIPDIQLSGNYRL